MIALLGVIFLGGFFVTVHPYALPAPLVSPIVLASQEGCDDGATDDGYSDDGEVCEEGHANSDDEDDKS